MSALGVQGEGDDALAVIVNMVSGHAVPCHRKVIPVSNRLFDGEMTVGQQLTPEGVPCWAMIFQVTFRQVPEGVIWLSVESDLLRPSLTTRSVWTAVSSVINIFNKVFLKFPWRWNYGTEQHRGTDGKPRGYIQFRFCDAYTLIDTPPSDGPPPDLLSFDCEREYPGIDPGARNGITFKPGHTYTAAVWTQFVCTERWALVDLPRVSNVPLEDHIGASPVYLCLRHDLGKEQELLIDTAVYHRRIHSEMYQRYMPSRPGRSPPASVPDSKPVRIAGPLDRHDPVSRAAPVTVQRKNKMSLLAVLALPALADVLFWLVGRELAFADRAAFALAGLAVFAALHLVGLAEGPQADVRDRQVLQFDSEPVRTTTTPAAPVTCTHAKNVREPSMGCFSGCLPVGKCFSSSRPLKQT